MLKVAHELRAPVAAVQSYINLILAGYLGGSDLTPTLERVGERLDEMLDLISDLLNLAHLKQARERIIAEASPEPIADLLEEVCDLFSEQARQKDQTLDVEILERPIILANREHLKQIWNNLISNAIKYTPNGGRITISLRMDGDRVVGTVADSGIGIAEKDMQHLFQEFFRTDQAKASGNLGTGLGLSIVKQIVDSYGGEIRVSSQLGQGTQFTVMLPLEPREPVPDEEAAKPKTRPTRRSPLPTTHARAIIFGEDRVRDDGS
jgi:two-component system sensor histidine kinase VicK